MENCDCGNMGGAGFPMNNGFNTNGIGDPVCPGNNSYGSITRGGMDMSPRPLYVPFGKK